MCPILQLQAHSDLPLLARFAQGYVRSVLNAMQLILSFSAPPKRQCMNWNEWVRCGMQGCRMVQSRSLKEVLKKQEEEGKPSPSVFDDTVASVCTGSTDPVSSMHWSVLSVSQPAHTCQGQVCVIGRYKQSTGDFHVLRTVTPSQGMSRFTCPVFDGPAGLCAEAATSPHHMTAMLVVQQTMHQVLHWIS